jgi:hypothetical protein
MPYMPWPVIAANRTGVGLTRLRRSPRESVSLRRTRIHTSGQWRSSW